MKQKLFSLLTLLLVVCSSAWGQTVYRLIDRSGENPTINSTDFKGAVSSDNLKTSYGDKTFDESETLGGYIQLGGTNSSTSGIYQATKYIAYDVKTTSTKFKVYVWNGNNSNQSLYYSYIEEGVTSEPSGRKVTKTITSKEASPESFEFTISGAGNKTVIFYVGNTNVVFYQIEAIESGTTLSVGGERGYSVNLNKGRLIAATATASLLEGIEYSTASNYGFINKTAVEITTKGTHYIKFTTTQTTKTTVTVSSSNTYYVASTKDASSGVQATKTATADVELSAGTWYIVPNGSKVSVTNLAFSKPDVPKLTGAWKIGEDVVTSIGVVQGSSPAPTVPTFTVGAESGTPVAGDYDVVYSLKDGSTDGIVTFTAGVPTEISTANAGTATIVATLTSTDDEKFETPVTNTFEYTVTVSAASAPTISVTGESSAVRGADAITLTADVTGTPTPSVEWFKCDDALKTNPVSQGAASVANTTFNVTTTTVGTYYYYAVANNGVGGDVESSVKTITIVPKAPTMPASVKFETSKSVAITKADGEAGAATIKYKEGDGEWQDYTSALDITSTKTITAKVVQSGLESAEVSATYTKFEGSELTAVSTATTWNFANITGNTSHAYYASNGIQLTASTFPTNTTTNFYVYEDFKGDFYTVNGGKTFDGTSIAFSEMQYPIRNNAYAQGIVLRIKTSVPGVIKVKFNNTGGSRPYRYLKVNETVTEFRSASSSEVTSGGIFVPAGEVTLSGYIVNASDPQAGNNDVVGPAMLQFRQIDFEPLADADAVSVSSAGYATFVLSQNAYFEATNGVTAYAAKADGSKITLTEIKAAPASTPILLKADEGNYTLKKATSIAPAAVSTDINHLTAGPVTGDGASHYVLGKEGSKVGFGLLADGTDLPATKAYIAASKFSSPAHFFSLDGETTSIKAVDSQKNIMNGDFYNLAGQKVQKPSKGLYIMNGKKVIVK